ncbi:MAG: hypothetical protein ACLURV_00160 [Gallintestinimicrobium sp.]
MMTKWMRKNLWKKRTSAWRAPSLPEKQFSGKRRAQGAVHVVPNAIEVDKFSITTRCVHRCGKNWSWAIV